MYIWLGEGTSLNAVCTAKERIAYLKDRSEEITQNVAQSNKELENKKEEIRDMEDKF